MVALQNSGDDKQLWTDLINQLNSVYGCFSFLRQQSSWHEAKERPRVANLRQKKGDLLHHLLFPHWQGQTWCKWARVGMQHLVWHDTVCHTQLCLHSQWQLSQQQLLQRFPSEWDLFLAPKLERSQCSKACTISRISAGWLYSWLEDAGEVSVQLMWFLPSCL